MNKHALYHRPDSNFAYAADKNRLVIVLRTAADDEFDRVEILYNNKYDFTKERSAAQLEKCAEDGLFAYYRAEFILSDLRFAYIFRITEKGRIYYFSEAGLSDKYDLKLAYYTFFQFPFINGADVMPVVGWTENAVFYQIFVDRFARGDFDKDGSYINTPWDGEIDRYSFAGGDLDGIREKLPYLKDLGITAIYLTPIFLSDTNHKYNVIDYMRVDPQFGDNDKLLKLLAAAHGEGMKVIIDTVFNHCDASHGFFCDAVKRGRKSAYFDWFMIDGDFPDTKKGNYACFAHCNYMPKWNTSNAETRRYLIDVALGYLKWGFDGLRLDVADEISHVMLAQLRREVKEKFPQALILGEIWHDNEHWLRGDNLDGVMNYKLQKILVDYFNRDPITADEAANRLNALLVANTEQVNSMALNFLDNHDTPRFLRFSGGNCDKLLCALCAAVVFPGMPCVFYGDEIPLDGDGDPDCRKTFDWTFARQNKDFAEKFKTILALKKQSELKGGTAEISAADGILKIARGGKSRIVAYFNASGEARALPVGGETLFSLNFENNRILNNGAVVVKLSIL